MPWSGLVGEKNKIYSNPCHAPLPKEQLWLLLQMVTLTKAIITVKFPCNSKDSVASMCFLLNTKK